MPQGSRALRRQAKAANSPQQLRAAILDLIQLRRRAGLHCRSQVPMCLCCAAACSCQARQSDRVSVSTSVRHASNHRARGTLVPMLPDAPTSHVCCAQVKIVEADDSLYAATIDDVVAMKLGPRSWSPADCLPVHACQNLAVKPRLGLLAIPIL
jgi:Alpha-amylase C-terminal beta-sheet domain